MSILDEGLALALPFTNARMCYDRLELFPPIKQAFYDTMIPTATSDGDLLTRLIDTEAQRQQALDDYLEAGNSLREVDTTLNCCLVDLYTAIFSAIGSKIKESDLAQADKLDLVSQLHDMLPHILSWNPTRRTQLDLLIKGIKARIQVGE